MMTVGWAMLLGAASMWTVQIVWKDLKKADRRIRNNG